MPLYRPSQLMEFLKKIDKRPSKGLSQNFLIDGNTVQKILRTCNISKGDLIIEIGPGPGVLTEALLEKKVRLVAIEKDELLAKHLSRLNQEDLLEVFCEDFLKFPLQDILMSHLEKNEKAKVIASPPYHITTPILEKLIACRQWISHVVLILQEEFVNRIIAKSGSKEYSSFSLFVQSYAKATCGGVISRRCFYPSPKVDSAILLLEMKEPPFPQEEMEKFHKMIRQAFGHRRKMLVSSLKDLYEKQRISQALNDLGYLQTLRPEDCSLDDFTRLFKSLEG